MNRAIVIKMAGNAELAAAVADGMTKVLTIGGKEMDMIKAENKQLKAKQGVKEFAEDAAWKEIKAKMARTYRVKRHGKVYNFILLTWAMLCCAIQEEYKRLSAWNREG